MAVAQPPGQLAELQHSEEILLQELQKVDEILLEELERVDERLLRIAAAIDQLPERVASTKRRDQRRPESRPFDPYGEDEIGIEAAAERPSTAGQVVRRLRSWGAAYARDREALGLAPLSLAVALLATAIAVLGLIVAVAT
jgi:hypothetical protein